MNIDPHLLNVDNVVLPEHVYRIIPLERFLETCCSAQNVLVASVNWPDPYEAAQLRTQIEYPLFVDEKRVFSSGLRDNIPRKVGGTWRSSTDAAERAFCQCWSNLPESDAMWRLYSPDTAGVKLRSRPRSLLLSLHEATSSEKVFLGAMEYLPQEELDELVLDAKKNHLIQSRPDLFETMPGEAWARCLLRKRIQFEHEAEYRLILALTHPDTRPDTGTLFRYTFRCNETIDEVELDPRCSDPYSVEQAIRTAGYTGVVRRSKLYKPPSLIVRPTWPENEGWSTGSSRKWIETGKK